MTQQCNTTKPKLIKVYQLTFEDDCSYVGQTRQRMWSRLLQHKDKPVNTELMNRLKRGDKHDVSIITKTRSPLVADKAEIKAIKKLANPINVTHTDKQFQSGNPPLINRQPFKYRRKRDENRTDRPTRCSLCHIIKSSVEFSTDRSRFNGLNSRCHPCHNKLKTAIRKARARGEDVSLAYQTAKQNIIAERRKR